MFNVVFKTLKMHEESRWSTMIMCIRTRTTLRVATTRWYQAVKPHYEV